MADHFERLGSRAAEAQYGGREAIVLIGIVLAFTMTLLGASFAAGALIAN